MTPDPESGFPAAGLVGRATCFVAGAIMIGLVVVPIDLALSEGISPSELVFARLFWGALFVSVACLLICRGTRHRTLRDHFRFARNGVLLGWGTTFLYTYALNLNDVAPVIVTLVGTAAIVGILIETGGHLKLPHMFVLTSVVVAQTAVNVSAHGGIEYLSWALAAAAGSGAIYAMLPSLCRDRQPGPDFAAVAWYLTYGCTFGMFHAVFLGSSTVDKLVTAAANPSAILAGIFGTGMGYLLFQIGISTNVRQQRIGSAWASILYGFEPVAAILAAMIWLNESLSAETAFFCTTFMVLAISARAVLSLQEPTGS